MRRQISLALLAVVVAGLALLESVSHIGRGWWRGEAFYHGRPSSYWAHELPRWQPGLG
jgi:hypothetical protein